MVVSCTHSTHNLPPVPPLLLPVKSLIQSTPTSVHFYRFITHCVSSWKISTLFVRRNTWNLAESLLSSGTQISWETDATYSWLHQLQGLWFMLHNEAALQSYKGLWSRPVGEIYHVLQICVAGLEIPSSCSPRPDTSASERKRSLKANKASFKEKGEQNGFELSAGEHAKYRWRMQPGFLLCSRASTGLHDFLYEQNSRHSLSWQGLE